MLADITLGQFFPGNSVIHKIDPRFKIIMTFIYVVMIFVVTKPIVIIIPFVFTVMAYLLSKISLKLILKSIKPVVPIIIFTSILNMFFIKGGALIFHFYFISIYQNGLENAILMSLRIIILISGVSLLTYTTSPITLTDGIERLLAPLKIIKFPVHELAMMMTIALRFIPTLIEETERIMSAQKARGADIESGGLVKRAKALIPILVPLLISAFRRAFDLATAMECRCYRGGEGRTKMKQLKLKAVDFVSMFIIIIFTGASIFGNILA